MGYSHHWAAAVMQRENKARQDPESKKKQSVIGEPSSKSTTDASIPPRTVDAV